MNFSTAVKECLSKYATFSGRASRSEFWWFILFVSLALMVGAVLGVFGAIIILPLLLPAISAEVRRLHDIDRSGWWVLLCVLPPVNLVVKLIWWTRKGTEGPNRFGDDPFDQGTAPAAIAAPAGNKGPTVSMADKTEQLAQIKSLLDAGTITQAEFETMKATIMSS